VEPRIGRASERGYTKAGCDTTEGRVILGLGVSQVLHRIHFGFVGGVSPAAPSFAAKLAV
jgi:hypothetical protein